MSIRKRCEESQETCRANRTWMEEWRGLYLGRKQEAVNQRAATEAAKAEFGGQMTEEQIRLYSYFMGRGDEQGAAAGVSEATADLKRSAAEADYVRAEELYAEEEWSSAMDRYDMAEPVFNSAREHYAEAKNRVDFACEAYIAAFRQVVPG